MHLINDNWKFKWNIWTWITNNNTNKLSLYSTYQKQVYKVLHGCLTQCNNLLGFMDEGSMSLPVLERFRGSATDGKGRLEGFLGLGVFFTGVEVVGGMFLPAGTWDCEWGTLPWAGAPGSFWFSPWDRAAVRSALAGVDAGLGGFSLDWVE